MAAAAAALWFKSFLLLSLLLMVMPFSNGMADGFQGGNGMQMNPKYSLQQGGNEMIHFQMMSSSSSSRKSRKLLRMGAMQDYDDTGANSKHDPRKKPGKP